MALILGERMQHGLIGARLEWYSRVVILHARKAMDSGKPEAYIRKMHLDCIKATA